MRHISKNMLQLFQLQAFVASQNKSNMICRAGNPYRELEEVSVQKEKVCKEG